MDRRKPPENKRRAIEGILGNKSGKQEDNLDPEIVRISEEEESTIVSATPAGRDDFQPEIISEKGGSQTGWIIALSIICIGLLASTLILARDYIFSLFEDVPTITDYQQKDSEADQDTPDPATGNVEQNFRADLENLKKANISLQSALEAEKERNLQLDDEIKRLKADSEITLAEPAAASEQTGDDTASNQLRDQLAQEKARADRAEESLESLNERMVNYARENSRLNKELEFLNKEYRSTANLRRQIRQLENSNESLSSELEQSKSQIEVLRNARNDDNSSEQYEQINKEYRRVLDLLKETRASNNKKQDRIEQLMEENVDLQRKLDATSNTSNDNFRYASSNTELNSSEEVVKFGYSQPKAIDITRPKYPSSAYNRRISGIVRLRVLVSERGRVLEAEVIDSPDPLKSLDRAAIDAVMKWRFDPARQNGNSVRVWHEVPIRFSLNR